MKTLLLKTFCTIIFIVSVASSCNRNTPNSSDNSGTQNEKRTLPKSKIHFILPLKNSTCKSGNKLIFQVELADNDLFPDSIEFLIDGKTTGSVKSVTEPFTVLTDGLKMGTRNAEAIAFFKGNRKDFANIVFKIFAPSPPVNYNYNIIEIFPHDINAFTQGLIYEDGFIFEGTGEYTQSTLRKEKLSSGELILSINLPSDVFGEGVTAFDDKLIQLTWKEQVAFIYDKATFKLINKLHYPIKEGWGITYDGKNLIMSDGSAYLYYLKKEDMSEVDRLEVSDDKGPVEKLNELEYINGEIWANVWQTDYIIRINAKNGAVNGKLDLSGLLKAKDRHPNTDVLNGIAFIPQTNHLIVTGKNWPKLFEISVHK